MKILKTKKFFSFAMVVLLVGGCFFLFKPKKAGFSLAKVRSPLTASSEWTVDEPSSLERTEIHNILSQDFNYLGSGAQMYAFISADGKYVLKFFKMKHLLPKTWLKWLPLPGLENYRFRKVDKRILRQKELFQSYKWAYQDLKEETGLVFIHLNKTKNLPLKVRLFDRMRKSYIVSLNDYEFVLQKRGQLVHERLISCMQKEDIDGAKSAIHNLLNHVVVQCKKGYVDRDSGVNHNYGYIGEQVIHFDVGRIQKNDAAKDPAYFHREVLRFGAKLSKWLEIHYPLLLPVVEEEINEMLDLAPHH